jgi:N utilization substance protein A
MFIESLDVDEVIAQLLVTEGFTTIDEVAFVPIEEIADIEGFDEDIAQELSNRANEFLTAEEERHTARRVELGVEDDVAAIEGLTSAMLAVLGENEIKTLDDLGDLAGDELIEMLPDFSLAEEEANNIIMAARAHWFDDEEEPAAEEEAAEAVEGSDA